MKKILIAIPTARNIEAETFKSIYSQQIPEGYTAEFQYFYGYSVDQVRNLIADWAVRNYDYLWAVDADMSFSPDTLQRLLSHDQDMVTGIYRQRREPEQLELYGWNDHGGQQPLAYWQIHDQKLVEVAGCGFGCVLVKSSLLAAVGYPQFQYHHALNHRDTVSEDLDFCRKVHSRGYKIWADPQVVCDHIGSHAYTVRRDPQQLLESRLRDLGSQDLVPQSHQQYLTQLSEQGLQPQVIYDLGACVLHWHQAARRVWPHATIKVIEAQRECEFLYQEKNLDYAIELVGERTGQIVPFYQNAWHPGGNSRFLENPQINPDSSNYFDPKKFQLRTTKTLDQIREEQGWPWPDLIKMDIQGSELAALQGSEQCLVHCKDLILELQHCEYNQGAPDRNQVITWLLSRGFRLVRAFTETAVDGDYHFQRLS
jgi:FkbM family methyltransferase